VGARVAGNQTLYFTACGQVTLFCKVHQTFGVRLQALGLGQRGLDGLMLEQAYRQVRQHMTLVCRSAAQARSFCWGWHEFSLCDLRNESRRSVVQKIFTVRTRLTPGSQMVSRSYRGRCPSGTDQGLQASL